MAHNSLLEIESVRKRLEKLDEERQGLSDLIRRLREIRDVMTVLMTQAAEKQNETANWSSELRAATEDFVAGGTALKQNLAAALQDFQGNAKRTLQAASEFVVQQQGEGAALLAHWRSEFDDAARRFQAEFREEAQKLAELKSTLAVSVESKVQDQINALEATATVFKQANVEQARGLTERYGNAITELHKAFNLRADEFDDRFEQFSRKHLADLEQVNTSYQRIRAAYDALQSSLHTMEISLESKTQILQRQYSELERNMQIERENHNHSVEALTHWLGESLGKFQLNLQNEMNELSVNHLGLQDLMQARDKVFNTKLQQTWIGILLGAVISLAALLLSRF